MTQGGPATLFRTCYSPEPGILYCRFGLARITGRHYGLWMISGRYRGCNSWRTAGAGELGASELLSIQMSDDAIMISVLRYREQLFVTL